ncbi:MAG: hypothetical protein O7A69_06455 [SAR324 cluster bacterium]|nr:hypothetical protein [SAR324 cluster bacterium]MCZ6557401.1 hypothetical protein [SAR324 cluster bacterium]MCZ6647475.1 hypothetical protein [SAR324 cluster bacterium]MCZ6729602.1 hypothetical protein [SAR324 cluster bacterium]
MNAGKFPLGFHFIRESPGHEPIFSGKKLMDMEKTKQQIQTEIEQARHVFYATGHRIRRLAPADAARLQNAKPRKQRFKMFA